MIRTMKAARNDPGGLFLFVRMDQRSAGHAFPLHWGDAVALLAGEDAAVL